MDKKRVALVVAIVVIGIVVTAMAFVWYPQIY
jgi:hypothetical protein